METIESIVHVVDEFSSNDRRFANARKTWDRLYDPNSWWTLLGFEHQRDSISIGDPRGVPYVGDLFRFGVEAAEAADDAIVVFTNSDICITPEAPNAIRQAMQGHPCCWGRRVDVDNSDTPLSAADLTGPPYFGVDLFAVRPSFWQEHFAELPDMFLGTEAWDMVYLEWMKRHGGVELPPVIYHERHEAFWHRPETWDNPARVHNRRMHAQFLAKMNLQ